MTLAVGHHLVAERARWLRCRDRCCDKEMTYKLPDGNIIIVGDEHVRCSEVLFQPEFSGVEASGIHDMSFPKTTSPHSKGSASARPGS